LRLKVQARHYGRLARIPLTHGQPHHQALALKSSSKALPMANPTTRRMRLKVQARGWQAPGGGVGKR